MLEEVIAVDSTSFWLSPSSLCTHRIEFEKSKPGALYTASMVRLKVECTRRCLPYRAAQPHPRCPPEIPFELST